MSRIGGVVVYVALGVIAVALIAMLALPVWSGMQARAAYEAAVAEFNRQAAPMLRLETVTYEKGWLTSRAETLLHHSEYPFKLKVAHDLRHGPLHLAGLVTDEPALMMGVFESTLTPGSQAMVLASGRTFVSLTGDTRSEWKLDEQLAAMLGAGSQPVWARLDYRADTASATVQAQLPEAEGQGPQGSFALSDLRVRLDIKPARAGGFSVGSYGLSVTYLRAGDLATMTTIDDLRLQARATERADKVDTEMALSVEQVDSPAGVIGPARFVLQLNNLDAAAVAAYAEMQEQLLDGMDPLQDQQALAAQFMPQLMSTLPDIFSQAEVRIPTLYVATPDGAVRGNATVLLPPLPPEALTVPMAVLTSVDLDANVAIDEAMLRTEMERALRTRLVKARAGELAEGGTLLREEIDEDAATQADSQLSVLTTQGYLDLDEGVYRARFTMEGGNILVNGNPLNPMALMPGAGMPVN